MKLTRRGFFAGIGAALFVVALPVIKILPRPVEDYFRNLSGLAAAMQRTRQRHAAKMFNAAFMER